MEILLFLLGLGSITVVGHGIWVGIAALLRALRAGGQTAPPPRASRCPACHEAVPPEDRFCPVCGLDQSGSRSQQLRDLEATRRTLLVLFEAGDIDRHTADRLEFVLKRQRNHVLDRKPREPSAPSRIPPVPSSPRPVEVLDALPVLEEAPPDRPLVPIAAIPAPVFEQAEADELLATLDPAPPPRPLTDVLVGFMAARNILWGELVGGLLIVGCSIALVLTLWGSLQELPYFPFLLFSTITAALFGAGWYTLHHWKLESTSRGLLIIVALLAPLDLLVLADPSARGGLSATGWIHPFVAAAALLFFGWMIWISGRDLIGAHLLPGPIDRRWLLAIAIVGTAGTQLFTPDLYPASDDAVPLGTLLALAFLPGACYLLTTGAVLAGLAMHGKSSEGERPALGVPQTLAMFSFLGLAAFALLAALAFLQTRSAHWLESLPALALPVALAGVPGLAAGLLVRRRLPVTEAGTRTAGTAVTLVSLALLLVGLGIAWPHPWPLLIVASVNAVSLTLAAYRGRAAWLHAGGLPCLALAVLVAVLLVLGGEGGLVDRLPSVSSGLTLALLVASLAGLAVALDRRGHRDHALAHARVAACLGVVALFLATSHGPAHPALAACIHGLLAFTALGACLHAPRHRLAQPGCWLLLPASLWALQAVLPDDTLLWGAVVAGEGVLWLLAAFFLVDRNHPVRIALQSAGAATGLLALGLMLPSILFGLEPNHVLLLALVAAQAFLLAGQTRQAILTFVGSAATLAALLTLTWQLPASLYPLPTAAALLAHATLGLAAAFLIGERDREGLFTLPLEVCSCLTSLFAIPFVLGDGVLVIRAGHALWASCLWAARAWWKRSPGWFALAQAGTSASVLLALRALVDGQGWFGTCPAFDPRVLQLDALALALLGLVWVGLRRLESLARLWPTDTLSLDQLVAGGLVIGQFLLLALHVAPGISSEWFPHATPSASLWWNPVVFDSPGWLATAALALLLLGGLRKPARSGEEAFRIASVGGLFLLALCAVLLWAGPFGEERATATALRWGLAGLFVAGSVLLWNRERFAQVASDAGFAVGENRLLVRVLVSLSGVAVFALSATSAGLALAGLRRGGPVPDTFFAGIDSHLSNLGPLVLLAVGLWGSALRERSAVYAFVACQLGLLTALAGYALSLRSVGQEEGVALCLVGIAAASLGALGWLAAGVRIPAGHLLRLQAWLGLVAFVVLGCLPPGWWLIRPEAAFPAEYHLLGQWPGWLTLALAFGAAYLYSFRHAREWQVGGLSLTVLLSGVLAGCLASSWASADGWHGYHVLTLTWCASMTALVGTGFWLRRTSQRWPTGFAANPVSLWGAILGAVLCLAALRGRSAPWQPWVPGVAALAASFVFAAPALWFGRSTFSYPSGLAILLAGWIAHDLAGPSPAAFLLATSLSLAIASALWSLPDVRDTIPFSTLAGPLAVAVAACAVWLTPASQIESFPHLLGWGSVAMLGLALYLERSTPLAGPSFYALLLSAIGLGLMSPIVDAWGRPSATGLALTLHVGVSAWLGWRFRDRVQREWAWFFPVQVLLMAIVAFLAVRVCASDLNAIERLLGPIMLLLLVPAGWLMEEATPSLTLLRIRGLGPIVLAAAVASLAIALPQAQDAARAVQILFLERSAWLVLAVTATAVVYLEWSARPASESAWVERLREATRPVGQVLFALALILALAALGEMMPLFDPLTRRTPLSQPAILAVFAALFASFVTTLRMALLSNRDPLGLSDRGRQVYVYLAELLLVFVFVNARLNVPEMFRGAIAQYWPVIVMLIAFLGVGLSELFERRGLGILAVPLQRTAIFLPLIPLVAFWARPPAGAVALARDHAPGMVPFLDNLTKLPWHFDAHAGIWFLAGGLYLVLAFSRRSTRWAMTAALAANFGLWALWASQDVAFFRHPQVWLIPLGLIVLASEHLERKNLSANLSASLRYLGICLIYVASSAELFITGLGNSAWLPIILACLCVAGVLAGIWLRVKAFLFLGISFLLLDLGTMIWYAAVDRAHTWLWWASGIVLGVAILALFALFEKRRNDVLRLLEDLRGWD